MNKLRAILVDDEESARDVLENLLLRFCPEVQLLDKCKDVEEAVQSIRSFQPDVVFLDIEMPNYAGYELVDFFTNIDFEIIFVTAYDQYAIKAFEVSAVDYLLKPIEIDRLKQSVSRISNKFNRQQNNQKIEHLRETLTASSVQSILVSKKGNQYVVNINDIIAVEAQESYSCIHTKTDQYIMSKNLKHFERLLSEHPYFIRSHKSWIININHIQHYSKSEMTIQLDAEICAKLSKYKKVEFEELITR